MTWHPQPQAKEWNKFHPVHIQEFKRTLLKGGGPSNQQEDYGLASYVMFMNNEDGESIVDSIMHCSEKVYTAEANMAETESRMQMIEQAPPPQSTYPAPQIY